MWREHYYFLVKPKRDYEEKVKKVIIIQKYLRGRRWAPCDSRVYEEYRKEISQRKLKSTFDYFDKIREGIKVDLQIKLKYLWRKYVVSGE